jgi:hypothetical protein
LQAEQAVDLAVAEQVVCFTHQPNHLQLQAVLKLLLLVLAVLHALH